MAETLQECMARLRRLAMGLGGEERDGRHLRRLDDVDAAWITNGCIAARVGDAPDDLPTVGGAHVIKDAEGAGGALARVPSLDVPTVCREEEHEKTEEIDEGCDGCDCGDCPGRKRKTRVVGYRTEVIEITGQVVFANAGEIWAVDPKYAPLLEGLGVRVAGFGMLTGWLSGELVVVVMARRDDEANIRQRAAEHESGAAA